jgi:hypothetical protein
MDQDCLVTDLQGLFDFISDVLPLHGVPDTKIMKIKKAQVIILGL